MSLERPVPLINFVRLDGRSGTGARFEIADRYANFRAERIQLLRGRSPHQCSVGELVDETCSYVALDWRPQ